MNKHAFMMSVGPNLDAALAELKRRGIKFVDCYRAENGNWIFKVMVDPKHFEPKDPNGTQIDDGK